MSDDKSKEWLLTLPTSRATLSDAIHLYLQQLAPHARQRYSAKLLEQALEAISHWRLTAWHLERALQIRLKDVEVDDPDKYCIMTPDGGCVSTDPRCMHQPPGAHVEISALTSTARVLEVKGDGYTASLLDQTAKTLLAKEQEIDQLKGRIKELEKEIAGWEASYANISQALNSGDGSYRP